MLTAPLESDLAAERGLRETLAELARRTNLPSFDPVCRDCGHLKSDHVESGCCAVRWSMGTGETASFRTSFIRRCGCPRYEPL